MAIYKSSFNKKPEKAKTQSKQKPIKTKPEKVKAEKLNKPTQSKKLNPAWIFLGCFVLIFIACVVPNNIFKNVLLGVFGLLIYPVSVIGAMISVYLLTKKQISLDKKYATCLISAVLIIWLIIHFILTSKLDYSTYGAFLSATYHAKTTAGGILFSLLSYPMVKYLTAVGAYIFSFIGLAVVVGVTVDHVYVKKTIGVTNQKTRFNFNDIEDFEMTKPVVDEETLEMRQRRLAKRKLGLEKDETIILSSDMPEIDISTKYPDIEPQVTKEYILTPLEPVIPPEPTGEIFNRANKITSTHEPIRQEPIKPISTQPTQTEAQTEYYTNNQPTKPQYYQQPTPQTEQQKVENSYQNNYSTQPTYQPEPMENNSYTEDIRTEPISTDYQEKTTQQSEQIDDDYSIPSDDLFDDLDDDFMADEDENYDEYSELSDNQDDTEDLTRENDIAVKDTEYERATSNDGRGYEYTEEEIHARLDKGNYHDEYADQPKSYDLGATTDTQIVQPSIDLSKFNLPNTIKPEPQDEQMQMSYEKEKVEIPPYIAPPVELLDYIENKYTISDQELQDNIERLEQVLEDFKVPAKVNNVQVGPAVTRYELTMPRGISVNRIEQMSNDIAMTLASNGAIRVEAPIPGKASVGVEVPNQQVTAVSLRELIDNQEFRGRGNPLSFVLGKDINGDIKFCNLDKMPHLLIAGSTGSGKSVCLNTMILSMCYKVGPEDLRLILIDPKIVEFAQYSGLPHLLLPEIINTKVMAINALDWAIREMERRYVIFEKNRVVNINEYNKLESVKTKQIEKLPYIVIVVDELADLIMEAKREIEDRIAKLAAKSRAAGIHLVIATQRPSVDVITGTIKANLPSRIAFALTNFVDSKTILDGGGAEKLLGKGDMLYKPQDKPEPIRIQGAYVSREEINQIVDFIKENNRPVYDEDAGREIRNPSQDRPNANYGNKDVEFDPILPQALKMFIDNHFASGSMIQRRFSVGFNRAGRIMEQMEQAGFISKMDTNNKSRKVLINKDEFIKIFGDVN